MIRSLHALRVREKEERAAAFDAFVSDLRRAAVRVRKPA